MIARYTIFILGNVIVNYSAQCTVLPVNLTSFLIRKNGVDALLSWTTKNKVNTDHFSDEHSVNDNDFAEIGSVTAAGRSATKKFYTYSNKSVQAGKHYYRLKMVHKDGKFIISDVRIVEFNDEKTFHVFPNPSQSTLAVEGVEAGMVITILSSNGRKVMSQNATSMRTQQDVSKLSRGTYFVQAVKNGPVKLKNKFTKI